MPGKRARVDTAASAAPLMSNPFAALPALTGIVPEAAPEAEATPVSKNRAFHVARTRKGGYPVSLEKRPSGKMATVVRNVSGDAEALVSLLKKRCAAGGKAFEDAIEIQGDQRAKVEAALREFGC